MFARELEFQIAAADGELVMFTWEDCQGLCLGEVRLCVCVCVRHGTGSLGHRVNGSFWSSFTSGSPGDHFDPV